MIHPPAVTLLIVAALALVNLWLGVRVSQVRIRRNIMVGDDGDPLLKARMRAQANFVEYVPMAAVLMALIEIRTGESTWLWAAGAVLVAGRLLHPFGMERPSPNPPRMIGILLTWGVTAALVGWAIWLGYRAAGLV